LDPSNGTKILPDIDTSSSFKCRYEERFEIAMTPRRNN
jgi:hypothetical protein